MLPFVVFSSVLAGLCFLLGTVFPGWLHPQIRLLFAFLLAVSLAGHVFLRSRIFKNPENWVNPYMIVTVFRLVSGAGFVIVAVLNGAAQTSVLLLNFFLLYFSYAGFEIYWLVSNLRRNFK